MLEGYGKLTKISGAKALVDVLYKNDVRVIFGYPGGVVLPLYDELYDSSIRHILVRHEQGAAHAADGYAKATGKVGVCLATSGPGATNLVTGIASAYMDSVPVLAITGQVRTNLIGNDAFQEADITGITMPVTKHNYLLSDVEQIVPTVNEALYIARTGRPGPVLIDIPTDLFVAEVEFKYTDRVELRGYRPTMKGHSMQIKRAKDAIAKSERPVIVAGGGVIASDGCDELRAFAEKIDAPVTTTLMGLGAFPETHELSLGMPGMHGTKYANYAITESDLLVAIGMRFDDRVTGNIEKFAPNAKVIHIDIDPAEIGKNVGVDIPIVGDAKHILGKLLSCMEARTGADWHKRISEWKHEHPLTYGKDDGKLRPQYIIEQVYDACPDAIITTDVGQNQMWAAQFFKYTRPRTYISSGGLGVMGYGLPAAIGAKVGCPDNMVFDIAGDGSLLMLCHELATAVENDIAVKVILLNNRYLGMVRQWQQLFYDRRYSHTDLESRTDFVKLAEAFGASAVRVTDVKEVRPAIEQAMNTDGVYLIDFQVEREENVSPMVPVGASINQIMDV